MGYSFFSDESGIHTSDMCYTIGAILVPNDLLDKFQSFLEDLVKRHHIESEIKWERVRRSYNIMNFSLDLLKEITNGPYVFTSIVVLKSAYRKWHADQDSAFYTTYTLLLEHCTDELGTSVDALMDEKCESYPKHHEVVETITNYKLKGSDGVVKNVSKKDSKQSLIIQAADILTGAINASHHMHLDPTVQINNGKKLLIHKLSEVLGWDALHYDTYPNADVNIWHFPEKEYRGKPETKEITQNLTVPHVSLEEMESWGI